jgi:hypothetical protein
MTITQIVLGSLNIIAAGVLMWFAAQSSYARQQWVHHMRAYEQMRDGINTGAWIKALPGELQLLSTKVTIDESTFYMLTPEERTQIVNRLKGAVQGDDLNRPRSEEEIRQAIASLFWNTGQRTRVTMQGDTKKFEVVDDPGFQARNPAAKIAYNQEDITGGKADAEMLRLAATLGPRGFSKLVRAAIEQQYPRIELDQREGAAKLYFARSRLADAELALKKVEDEVQLLVGRRDVEKQLLAQAEAENRARRLEITRLQADVEEALAAYTLVLGRELDKQRLFADLKLKAEQTVNESSKLIEEIRKKELGPDGQ